MYVRVAGPCSPCSQVMAAWTSRRIFPPKRTPRTVSQWPPFSVYTSLGLGQAPSGIQTAESIAAAGATTTAGILGTLSALAATSVSLSAVTMGIGAAVAGVIALSVAIYNAFKGCGQTCIQASKIANQVEPLLLQNLNTYLAAPVHYASLQAAAINNFQTAWNALVTGCSAQALQQAGVNCIGDRQSGSCKWHTSTPGAWQNGVWVPPGPQVSSGGACWDWWIGYHDPIANDPTVVPDPSPTLSSGAASIEQALGISPTSTIAGLPVGDLVLPAALLILALLFL